MTVRIVQSLLREAVEAQLQHIRQGLGELVDFSLNLRARALFMVAGGKVQCRS